MGNGALAIRPQATAPILDFTRLCENEAQIQMLGFQVRFRSIAEAKQTTGKSLSATPHLNAR